MFPGQGPSCNHTFGSGPRHGPGLHIEIEKLYVRLGVSKPGWDWNSRSVDVNVASEFVRSIRQ